MSKHKKKHNSGAVELTHCFVVELVITILYFNLFKFNNIYKIYNE